MVRQRRRLQVSARRRLSRLLLNLVLLMGGVLAGLGLAEAFLRLRGTIYSVVEPHPDPVLGYILKPGLEATVGGVPHSYNSRGLRDEEFPEHAAAGTLRLLVVGDSVAYGETIPADATFPKRLQESLNRGAPPGRRYEVINGGISGYNACQEEAFFRDIGAAYHADVVIWEYCLNDVMEAWDPFGSGNMGFVGLPVSWKRALRQNLVLWNFARVHAYELLGAARNDSTDEGYARRVFDLYGPSGEPLRQKAWGCIERGRADIRTSGARMLMAVFPFRQQLSPGWFDASPQQDVARRAASLGIESLDLLPEFEHADEDPFASPDFIHLSKAGHQRAAEAIAHVLEANDPVPSPGAAALH
jgi:lysophospholipase L1-like esterase